MFGKMPDHRSERVPMDYTKLSAGTLVQGHLTNGEATEATVVCPKCHRVGLASAVHEGETTVVHQGMVIGETLESVDFCTFRNEKKTRAAH